MLKNIYTVAFLTLFILVACSDDNGVDDGGNTDDDGAIQEIAAEDRLPLFEINTNGANIVDEPKIDAQLTITEAGTVTHTGAIGIEIRGSSSQFFPKKQFGFETRDEANEDVDVSLMGFPEEEDWILYAPYSDKSLVRNHLIYELSNDMGRYASRSKLVEVRINDAYNGVYVFMEKLKRDDNRIDINKLKDDENSGEDLTGGYILKLDKADGSNETSYNPFNSFPSSYAPLNAQAGQDINFLYDDPDAEDITPEQKTYISQYVAAFEDALASPDFMDPALGYRNYIDVDSFIDFFLLTEVSNNVDGYRLSTWLTKDKNEKLKMGPIWDFNLAFGNADYCDGGATNVWGYKFNERCPTDVWQTPFWWDRLLEDPTFVTQLKERWTTLRASTFAENNMIGKIDGYVDLMETGGAINANFNRWQVLGQYVWPNNFVGQTYTEEMEYLKNWISDRLVWLDGAIEGL